MRKLVLTLLLLCLTGGALHATSLVEFQFSDPAKDQLFRQLTGELRCLVCQNESLAGSNAELAQDLRKEIYEMMQQGKGREEIIDFMVARYGDFVLYQPPLKPSTYPLWYGPFILLAIAAVFLFRTLIRKKRAQETALSDQDQQRLDELLGEQPDSSDPK